MLSKIGIIVLILISPLQFARGAGVEETGTGNESLAELRHQILQLGDQVNALADENAKLNRLFQQILSVTDSNEQGQNVSKRVGVNLNEVEDKKITLTMDSTGGITYTRWGRTICEAGARVVYSGYASTSGYNSQGGSSDIVCLHAQPQFNYAASGAQSAILSGVQYRVAGLPFSTSNNGGQSLFNNDMPCAVCHVSTRTNQLMIPGRNTCPSGWVMEYWGFLLCSGPGHYRNAMACVDNAPETVPGGIVDQISLHAYPVTTKCTALHCPPYIANYDLSCVVCSK